jgi:hypothetical protein
VATIDVRVCDICGKVGARPFTVIDVEGGDQVTTDLCSTHDQSLLKLLDASARSMRTTVGQAIKAIESDPPEPKKRPPRKR